MAEVTQAQRNAAARARAKRETEYFVNTAPDVQKPKGNPFNTSKYLEWLANQAPPSSREPTTEQGRKNRDMREARGDSTNIYTVERLRKEAEKRANRPPVVYDPFLTDLKNPLPSDPEEAKKMLDRMQANLPPSFTNLDWLLGDVGDGESGESGGAGGVSFTPISAPRNLTFDPMNIDRSLYALEETATERQMLQDARADLDARARAGAQRITNAWADVQETNRAAAEKSFVLAGQYGTEALGLWTQAADQARQSSVLRAAAVMANQGRAPIDLDSMAGGGAFIAAMEMLALPEAARAFAEGEMQAERSEFVADLASRQADSYKNELETISIRMSVDMAREHNARVLDRIGRERLALSEAERSTGMFNRQMQEQIGRGNIERQFTADQFNIQNRMQAEQFNAQMRQAASQAAASRGTPIERQLSLLEQALGTSAFTGNTSILRQAFPELSQSEAQSMIDNIPVSR